MNKVIFRLFVATPLMLASTAAFAGNPVDNYAVTALTGANYQQVVATLEPIVKRDRGDEIGAVQLRNEPRGGDCHPIICREQKPPIDDQYDHAEPHQPLRQSGITRRQSVENVIETLEEPAQWRTEPADNT